MADDPTTFIATVDKWVTETPERINAVFRESAQRVASIAANGVPVDTGYARASVRASLESMPQIDPASRGDRHGHYTFDGSEIALTIAGADLAKGQAIYIGWTASYVIYLEYGHSSQAPSGFVRIAAEQWPQIVGRVTGELMAQ